MKYYEFDSIDGFLIGWHEDENRPNSTTIHYGSIPPRRAKWNGSAWVEDTTKEDAYIAEKADTLTKEQQAKQLLSTFDKNTATATDVKNAVAAILILLKDIYKS